MADLLFPCGPQHALPDSSDHPDVLVSCRVTVSLDNMSQSQATDHSLQNLLHVAEGQSGLCVGASLYQLHGAGDQSDLTSTEHHLVHLREESKEEEILRVVLMW